MTQMMVDIEIQADDHEELQAVIAETAPQPFIQPAGLDMTLTGYLVTLIVPAGVSVKGEVYRNALADGREIVGFIFKNREIA